MSKQSELSGFPIPNSTHACNKISRPSSTLSSNSFSASWIDPSLPIPVSHFTTLGFVESPIPAGFNGEDTSE